MDTGRAIAAGAIGTAVMTALLLVEPSIGLPQIAVGELLSTAMSVGVAHLSVGAAGGWLLHLVVGVVLALVYAKFFAARLRGSQAARGALFGAGVFVIAQLFFMPFVGAGIFSGGDLQLLAGSLIGHLVYGVVVGWIYGLESQGAPGALRANAGSETRGLSPM